MLIAALIAGIVIACRESALRRRIVAFFTAFALLTCVGTSYADGAAGCRITVQVSCPKGGILYAFLVDRKLFDRPMVGLQKRVVTIADKGVTSLSFDGVPPGVYGIRCFLDTNGNGKLDRGLFGPSEPWGMSFNSGRPERWPSWDQISFEVAGEDRHIQIAIPR